MAVLPTGIGPVTGYQIERSLRFNSADSAYLNRTPASAGSRTTWTMSMWAKRGKLGATNYTLFSATGYDIARFSATYPDTIEWEPANLAGYAYTPAVFRDPSAWYHIVFTWDSTNATAANRMRIYVNGVSQTITYTVGAPAQNTQSYWNSNVASTIGAFFNVTQFFDGYLTEINFIDGQALTPSSFGETDSATGVWKAKKYAGTYGTNGFYLKFADNSGTTSTTLGKDSSGNGNNWTPNNFSVTAGAGNDSMVDSPTSYGTDTGVGGEVRGNYCTWNPTAAKGANTSITNGNLYASASSNSYGVAANFVISSGKWYWEITIDSGSSTANGNYYGVGDANTKMLQMTDEYNSPYTSGYIAVFYSGSAGQIIKGVNGTMTNLQTGLATTASSDVLGFALDCDASPATLSVYRNNSLLGSAQSLSGIGSGIWVPFVGAHNAVDTNANFGQRAFAYTAPSGFKALCTTNLPTPTIGATSTTQADNYFGVALYSGTGSGNSNVVSGLKFTTDLWWQRARNAVKNNYLQDAVRGFGASKSLTSNSNGAEGFNGTPLTQSLSVSSTGFTVSGPDFNGNTVSETYVAWCWNAGGSNATNTAGTITSTVRANTTSGFSIVTYTGNDTSGSTVGHGLGVVPAMVICKNRTAGIGSGAWPVWHKSLTGGTYYLFLNTTAAQSNGNNNFTATPTSTVLNLGRSDTNNTATMVAYCFAEVAGYSAFGSYTGNGSADGPFIYTGFRPRFVIRKCSSATSNWFINDAARNPSNVVLLRLNADLTDVESSGANSDIDFLSNGFKIRATSTAGVNQSGQTHIYMAFAENPFKYSLAR